MYRTFAIFGILASLAASNVAHAGWQNGMSLNGLGTNGVDPNGMSLNGLGTNGMELNGVSEPKTASTLSIQAFELPPESR